MPQAHCSMQAPWAVPKAALTCLSRPCIYIATLDNFSVLEHCALLQMQELIEASLNLHTCCQLLCCQPGPKPTIHAGALSCQHA